MKRVTTYFALVLLGLMLSVPSVAYARPHSAKRSSQNNAKKVARKNAKQQKKEQKQSKKAMQSWKKHHHSGF